MNIYLSKIFLYSFVQIVKSTQNNILQIFPTIGKATGSKKEYFPDDFPDFHSQAGWRLLDVDECGGEGGRVPSGESNFHELPNFPARLANAICHYLPYKSTSRYLIILSGDPYGVRRVLRSLYLSPSLYRVMIHDCKRVSVIFFSEIFELEPNIY